ncbi:Fructosamine-3-kinase [Amycolatopsis pretoriensis]|uniref:Fructosamine-3-kinase n=1 Tax=Amycolatopsis pretoriensis TaxID=218821 RepID=A0A1H5QDR9_9PSEU|nr:aminoglycoside phosphotransferase family protein [Amycolatopsis pretoriensis]SEF24149.1 Fructosamine-3-kinase [Amycolatopsis pretoriensis]
MPRDAGLRDHVLKAAGVAPAAVESWTRLGTATFNTAYRVRLTGGAGLVVKVAPEPGAPALTYEHDLLRAEALFYRAVGHAAPVPRVVAADFSRRALGRDFLVLSELPGESWHDRPPGASDGLRHQLGGIVARLHRCTGSRFGYPRGEPAGSWRAAFPAMVESVLGDAERFGVALPRPAGRFRDVLAEHAGVLDQVTTPVLVHFDLWPGNILIRAGRITGIIDAERAFWGDPLADLASLTLFGDLDDAFRAGYRAAGGVVPADDAATARIAMYRCYLYLIMLVEMVPRGHVGREHRAMTLLVGRHLLRALAALERRTTS